MKLSGYGYRCVAGDTFALASLTAYGDEKYACEIMNANPEYCGVTVFAGGEILKLPIVQVPNDDTENEYLPSDAPWK